MKIVIKALLLIGILVLGYTLYETIDAPIRFKVEKEKRYAKVIEKLKDIRTAQTAYKSVRKKYTDNFDQLIHFVKNDSFMVIFQIGDLEDSMAVAQGLVKRDTNFVSILDSIFPANYPIDSLPYIPFTNGSKFRLKAGQMDRNGLTVQLFEAKDSDPYDIYDVLKVGSMEEPNTNGNWE